MANQRPYSAVVSPHNPLTDPATSPATDQQLLQRFLATADEAAFATLVERHGPMVLAVCRSVLRHAQDAEDACQATFLVLARKAHAIRKPGSLAHWLHGVAYRLAARARSERDRTPDRREPGRPPPSPLDELTGRELHRILHEEVGRLPASYRLPLILCYLEGQTQDEAARQLGWPATTVKGRVDRGRDLLRRRLSRRGLSLGLPLLVASMEQGTARGGLPAGMAGQTARAAVQSLAGGSIGGRAARAAALAEGWERAMLTLKWKAGGALALAAAILGAGVGLAAYAAGEADPPEARRKGDPPAPPGGEPKPPAELGERPRLDRRGDALPERALVRFGSARLRHGGRIYGSALSPDGKTLVTAGHHSVIVWSLETGKPLRRFPCDHGSPFVHPGLAFSPDGSRLGYVRQSLFACVWDVRTGKELQRFQKRFEDGIKHFWNSNCRFAIEGKELVTVSRSAIETWDVDSGKLTGTVPVKALALSPDGKTYFHSDGTPGLVQGDARTGKEVARLPVDVRYDGAEVGLALSPDGKTLALVHAQKQIQLRDAATGKMQASFPLPDSARIVVRGSPYWQYRLTFSADGKTLLLGTGGGIIHRWDVARGKELPALSKHHCAVTGMHSLPDGETLVSTGYDGLIRHWNLKTGRDVLDIESYEGDSIAAYSADGRFVAVADARGRIDLWDGRKGTMIRTIQPDGTRVTHLAFSPDGKLLAAAQRSGTVQFREVPSGRPSAVWRREPLPGEWHCNGILFSPDGRILYVTDCPKRIRAVEVASDKALWSGGGASFGEALSPDGKTLLVGRIGPNLALLDATTGKQRAKVHLNSAIPHDNGLPHTLSFSPDGHYLAVADLFGTLTLCNGRTCAETLRLAAGVSELEKNRIWNRGGKLPNRIRALAFSPNGRWLAAAGTDTAIYLWETASGQEVLRLPGHDAEVSTLAFAPDGRTLFSYGNDGQGYLWDLAPKTPTDPRPALPQSWADLAGKDAPEAYRAIHALAAHPSESVPWLRKHIRPAEPVTAERLARLIAALDDERFAAREQAVRELQALEERAEPALRRALEGGPPLEKSRRIEGLLKRLEVAQLTPGQLREVRAVEVLEAAGTPDARRLLEELAGGAEGARLTREARAPLDRLRP